MVGLAWGWREQRDVYNINNVKPGGPMWVMEHVVRKETKYTPTHKNGLSLTCTGGLLY